MEAMEICSTPDGRDKDAPLFLSLSRPWRMSSGTPSHFCDASDVGYGTVSYLRITYPDGTVQCSFGMGKSRNTPIKAPTIPRLELQSAVLAARIKIFLQRELDLQLYRTVFWTDSMITLYCINNESKRYNTYVANRIIDIRETRPIRKLCLLEGN
jgi:hypothetical protein